MAHLAGFKESYWRTRRALRDMAFLLRHYRNGLDLWSSLRSTRYCEVAAGRDGTTIRHPARPGLSETILEIFRDECYTREFYQPQSGDIVIDAGANVGIFSLWAARAGCHVTALEPVPENFSILEKNVSMNRLADKIQPLMAALGPASGRATIEDSGGRSLDHRVTFHGATAGTGNTVVLSIEDVLSRLRLSPSATVSLLKMDIEGGEHDVFEAWSSDAAVRFDRLAIEFHDNVRPGTKALIERRLAPTHRVATTEHHSLGYGIIQASRRRCVGALDGGSDREHDVEH